MWAYIRHHILKNNEGGSGWTVGLRDSCREELGRFSSLLLGRMPTAAMLLPAWCSLWLLATLQQSPIFLVYLKLLLVTLLCGLAFKVLQDLATTFFYKLLWLSASACTLCSKQVKCFPLPYTASSSPTLWLCSHLLCLTVTPLFYLHVPKCFVLSGLMHTSSLHKTMPYPFYLNVTCFSSELL